MNLNNNIITANVVQVWIKHYDPHNSVPSVHMMKWKISCRSSCGLHNTLC